MGDDLAGLILLCHKLRRCFVRGRMAACDAMIGNVGSRSMWPSWARLWGMRIGLNRYGLT